MRYVFVMEAKRPAPSWDGSFMQLGYKDSNLN
jgi:hypothetical protein